MEFIYFGIFVFIPAIIWVWFIVSMFTFMMTDKNNIELRKERKRKFIISAVVSGVMLLMFIVLWIALSVMINTAGL